MERYHSRPPWSDRRRTSRGERGFYGAFVSCISLTVMLAFASMFVQPIAVGVLARIDLPFLENALCDRGLQRRCPGGD